MFIKDIKRFCDSIHLLNESMSIRDFKSVTKNRYGGSGQALNIALQYFKSDSFLKKDLSLNDFLPLPIAFSLYVSEYYKKKTDKKLLDQSYTIVKETDEWVIACPFTSEASYFLTHKFLRHKGDEESFNSGPTWCISTENDDHYWNDYTKGKEYPVVYFLISKSNSRDRFAIVFNNLHQEQSQKEKDIEFSKENMEKGHSVASMNGEVRDFNQKLPRKRVIEMIKEKFNINLGLSIKSKRKTEINFTKIVYDNFNSTFESSQKAEVVDEKEQDIYKLMKRWTTDEKLLGKDFKNLYECLMEVLKKYGLKYKKDFHPKTFDLIVRYIVFHRRGELGWGFNSEPCTLTITSKEDIDAFYCAFLFQFLFLNVEFDSRTVFDDIVRGVVGDEEIRDEYLKVYENNIKSKKYPRLLSVVRKEFNNSGYGKEKYYEILRMVSNSIYGIPEKTLDLFYLLEPSLKKQSKGFTRVELGTIVDVLSNFKITDNLFNEKNCKDDKSRKDYILMNYGITEKGIIYNLNETSKADFDFLLDGMDYRELERDNLFEGYYTFEEGMEDHFYKGIKRAHKFLKSHHRDGFHVNGTTHIKKFVQYYDGLKRGIKYQDIEESSEELQRLAHLELVDIFKRNGYFYISKQMKPGMFCGLFYPMNDKNHNL